MPVSIFRTALCLLVLVSVAQATVLTYIMEKEVDQQDSYIEITAKIQVDGTSLKHNIDTAERLITNLKELVINDCQKSSSKAEAKNCKDYLEDSKFEVEPKYHLVRKIPTFTRTPPIIQFSSSPTNSPSKSRT